MRRLVFVRMFSCAWLHRFHSYTGFKDIVMSDTAESIVFQPHESAKVKTTVWLMSILGALMVRIPAHREQPFRLNVNTYSAPT